MIEMFSITSKPLTEILKSIIISTIKLLEVTPESPETSISFVMSIKAMRTERPYQYLHIYFYSDYLNSLMEWGPVFTLWSNSEDRLNPALGGMAKAAEDCCKSLQEVVCTAHQYFHMFLLRVSSAF